MKPKVRTKPMSWSSVSRNTRTACTSTSTATVAAMGAGTLKMGSRGLAADCSIKMAPDACQIGGGRCRNKRYDRRNWLPSPNQQKGGPRSSLLQPARMPNETPGHVWARPGAVTPFAVLLKIESVGLAAPQKLCAKRGPNDKGRGHNVLPCRSQTRGDRVRHFDDVWHRAVRFHHRKPSARAFALYRHRSGHDRADRLGRVLRRIRAGMRYRTFRAARCRPIDTRLDRTQAYQHCRQYRYQADDRHGSLGRRRTLELSGRWLRRLRGLCVAEAQALDAGRLAARAAAHDSGARSQWQRTRRAHR